MDIALLRSLLPITKNLVFLDHAGVAPISTRTSDAIAAAARAQAEFGGTASARLYAKIDQTRGLAATLLNSRLQEIAFVKNTSEGISFVAEGLPWEEGDNVIIPAGEYPANVYPWMNLARRGVEVRFARREGFSIPAENIFACVDSRTRAISVSFVQYSTGFRMDLKKIGKFARKHNIFFNVDAIQGLGSLPFSVEELGIDACAADAHKWLLGPEGIGIFYIRGGALERIRPVEVGWKSVEHPLEFEKLDFTLRRDASRFECGTPNVFGIHGLSASIELLLEVGIGSISARLKVLTDLLVRGLEERRFEIVSSRRENEWSGIVSFRKEGLDPQALRNKLFQEGIVLSVREGFLRASPHFYNTEEEIERFLKSLYQNAT